VHLDAIKANHDHRMVRLAEMIEERRQLVSDHESGRRLLESEEFDKASRQIVAFERKLEMMKKKTEDVRVDDSCLPYFLSIAWYGLFSCSINPRIGIVLNENVLLTPFVGFRHRCCFFCLLLVIIL